MDERLRKTVTTAVMAALICVATMIIQIPMPLTNGYVNFGDCFILAAAWILGAPWGFAAAGIGSAFADILTGYAFYAPATFIIKGLMAVVAVAVAALFKKHRFIGQSVGAVCAELLMICGYFLYSLLTLGNFESALTGIPGNLIQGGFGAVCGLLLIKVLAKTGLTAKLT